MAMALGGDDDVIRETIKKFMGLLWFSLDILCTERICGVSVRDLLLASPPRT